MILHTETSKLMYNWSFLFVVLHKPTLLPSTFKIQEKIGNQFVLTKDVNWVAFSHKILFNATEFMCFVRAPKPLVP